MFSCFKNSAYLKHVSAIGSYKTWKAILYCFKNSADTHYSSAAHLFVRSKHGKYCHIFIRAVAMRPFKKEGAFYYEKSKLQKEDMVVILVC